MSESDQALDTVAKAIQGLLAQALRDRTRLQAARSASMIAKFYPNCGLTQAEIEERITMAAIYALVPVDLGDQGPKP